MSKMHSCIEASVLPCVCSICSPQSRHNSLFLEDMDTQQLMLKTKSFNRLKFL